MNTLRRIKLKAALVAVLALGTAVYPLYGEIVETVEVTGKLFSLDSHSKNMVIVTAADLEELKIKNMLELFSFFTALNVSKRGAGESSFDITMRGSNFEQVLVLVEGVPLNNPQTGHFNSDFPFSVQDVERVEILRGGSSTTYGAGAFAGVVNIFLKKVKKKNDLHVIASGGEHKFYSASLHAGKKFNNFAFRVSVNKTNTDGYYEGREFDHLKLTAGGFYTGKNSEIDLQAGYLKKDFGAEGFYAPYPSSEIIKSYFTRLRWKQTVGKFDLTVNYSYNKHEDFFILDRNRPSFFQSESDTSLNFLNISAAYTGKKLSHLAGVELKGEGMESSSMGNRKRTRGALFWNVDYRLLEKTGFDAGVRRNFEPGGNSNFTYYTGFYHHVGKDMILRAGYGKSFRLPSFTELYYISPANKGNPDLEPEVSHNLEASFSLLKARHQFDVSVFYRKQKNMLDWVQYTNASGSVTPWLAVNFEKNDIIGAELTHRLRWHRTVLSLGVEALTAVNEQETLQSKYGLRFPDFTIKANLVQPLAKWLNVTANYTYKHIYRTTEKGHFMNLVLAVPLGNVELGLRVDNLFNSIIEEIPGLKVPGRWVYLTLEYRL
jgi:iron complex outermembrane receptor protein